MKIEGLKETIHALDELERKVEKRIIRKAVRDGAKIVRSAAQAEAPERSGITKQNIKIRPGKSGNGSLHMGVGVGRKDFKGEAFYASFVLYGHRVGSRKLGDARTIVPANNFLERAYDSSKEAAIQAITTSLQELISEAANS